jgi:hypothetical protein
MSRHPKVFSSKIPDQISKRREFEIKDSRYWETKSAWVKFDYTGFVFSTVEKARRFANGVQTGYRYFATHKTPIGVALYRAKVADVNKITKRLGMNEMMVSNREHW